MAMKGKAQKSWGFYILAWSSRLITWCCDIMMFGEWMEGGILIDVTSTYKKVFVCLKRWVVCTCSVYCKLMCKPTRMVIFLYKKSNILVRSKYSLWQVSSSDQEWQSIKNFNCTKKMKLSIFSVAPSCKHR